MPTCARLALTAALLAPLGTTPATAQMADFVADLAVAEAAGEPIWTASPDGCPATPLRILGVEGGRVRVAAEDPDRPGGRTITVFDLTRTGFFLEREGLADAAPRPRYVLLEARPDVGLYGFDIDAICTPAVPEPACTPRDGFGVVTIVLAMTDPCAGPD